MPGGTVRNWDSYGSKISELDPHRKAVLADPQTSGGLLISVDETYAKEFEAFLETKGIVMKPFGTLTAKKPQVVNVK